MSKDLDVSKGKPHPRHRRLTSLLANAFGSALALPDPVTHCAGDLPARLLLVLEVLGSALVEQLGGSFQQKLALRRSDPVEIEHGQYVAFELPVQLGQMPQAHDGHGMSQVSPALFGFFGDTQCRSYDLP